MLWWALEVSTSGHSPGTERAERADGDTAAAARHPTELAHREVGVGHELAEGDSHGPVERGVVEREALGVGDDQRCPSPSGGDRRHGGVEALSGE
jgi:hypothetical protein